MRTPQSIWSKLDRFPPVLVRLLARHPDGTAMSDLDIVSRCSMPLSKVKLISYSTSWDQINARDLRMFVQACGVDFANREQMRNANRYLRVDPKFTHLRRSRMFPVFKELLSLYATTLQ